MLLWFLECCLSIHSFSAPNSLANCLYVLYCKCSCPTQIICNIFQNYKHYEEPICSLKVIKLRNFLTGAKHLLVKSYSMEFRLNLIQS